MSKVQFKLRGKQQIEDGVLDDRGKSILMNGSNYKVNQLPWDVPVSGTVYGTLLNYKGSLKALENQLHDVPYKAPPKAPILYIKPVNTMIGFDIPIPLPVGVPKLEVGAALGIVIGRAATKISVDQVCDYIAGYTIVNDISIPHDSIYRPAISQRTRDGFCPIGPWIMEKRALINPDHLGIKVFVNGELCQENTTANLIRPVARLLSEITEFMTLNVGDTVLVGVPENPPLVKAGDRIRIEIDQIGYLENAIIHEDEWATRVGL